MVWFNPHPRGHVEYDYGYQTIEMIRNTVDMYQLTVEGLPGLKKLVPACKTAAPSQEGPPCRRRPARARPPGQPTLDIHT